VTDKMLFWILSDLHLEFTPGWELPSGDARPRFDVLVVGHGDNPQFDKNYVIEI